MIRVVILLLGVLLVGCRVEQPHDDAVMVDLTYPHTSSYFSSYQSMTKPPAGKYEPYITLSLDGMSQDEIDSYLADGYQLNGTLDVKCELYISSGENWNIPQAYDVGYSYGVEIFPKRYERIFAFEPFEYEKMILMPADTKRLKVVLTRNNYPNDQRYFILDIDKNQLHQKYVDCEYYYLLINYTLSTPMLEIIVPPWDELSSTN